MPVPLSSSAAMMPARPRRPVAACPARFLRRSSLPRDAPLESGVRESMPESITAARAAAREWHRPHVVGAVCCRVPLPRGERSFGTNAADGGAPPRDLSIRRSADRSRGATSTESASRGRGSRVWRRSPARRRPRRPADPLQGRGPRCGVPRKRWSVTRALRRRQAPRAGRAASRRGPDGQRRPAEAFDSQPVHGRPHGPQPDGERPVRGRRQTLHRHPGPVGPRCSSATLVRARASPVIRTTPFGVDAATGRSRRRTPSRNPGRLEAEAGADVGEAHVGLHRRWWRAEHRRLPGRAGDVGRSITTSPSRALASPPPLRSCAAQAGSGETSSRRSSTTTRAGRRCEAEASSARIVRPPLDEVERLLRSAV